jgi:hypothetical protein
LFKYKVRFGLNEQYKIRIKDPEWKIQFFSGFGVEQLRDNNFETYWQSDGHLPHLVNIQFKVSLFYFRQRATSSENGRQICIQYLKIKMICFS